MWKYLPENSSLTFRSNLVALVDLSPMCPHSGRCLEPVSQPSKRAVGPRCATVTCEMVTPRRVVAPGRGRPFVTPLLVGSTLRASLRSTRDVMRPGNLRRRWLRCAYPDASFLRTDRSWL